MSDAELDFMCDDDEDYDLVCMSIYQGIMQVSFCYIS